MIKGLWKPFGGGGDPVRVKDVSEKREINEQSTSWPANGVRAMVKART